MDPCIKCTRSKLTLVQVILGCAVSEDLLSVCRIVKGCIDRSGHRLPFPVVSHVSCLRLLCLIWYCLLLSTPHLSCLLLSCLFLPCPPLVLFPRPSWRPLGALLWFREGLLGASGPLGRSWAAPGGASALPWAPLGCLWASLGPPLGPFCRSGSARNRQRSPREAPGEPPGGPGGSRSPPDRPGRPLGGSKTTCFTWVLRGFVVSRFQNPS